MWALHLLDRRKMDGVDGLACPGARRMYRCVFMRCENGNACPDPRFPMVHSISRRQSRRCIDYFTL